MVIVYTTGVFDMLHPGHINILKKAYKLGDSLVVGIQSDNSAYRQKGRYPILNESQRKIMLESLGFVNQVIVYNDIEQTDILDKIKPNIMVQGSDREESADRTKIKTFLKSNNILLKFIPYTGGISTTQIKQKVINSFYITESKDKLINNISILNMDDILIYEKHDPRRTEKIIEDIKTNCILKNPIIIATIESKNILIDGNNRLNALKALGIKNFLVYMLDYKDNKIDLLNNIHYLDNSQEEIIQEIKKNKIDLIKIDSKELYEKLLIEDKIDFLLETEKQLYASMKEKSIKQTVEKLNLLVGIYIKKYEVKRISEMKESKGDFKTSIVFRKFKKNDIEDIIKQGLIIESGITRHKMGINILNVNLNLEYLTTEDLPYTSAKIRELLKQSELRHYYGNTYLFNN